MKRLIALFLFVQLFQLTVKANEGIIFLEGSFTEVLAKAKQQNKLVFLDCYTTWCGPCKWMAANVFTNDTVADYFNKTFICYKLDMEKGEGIEIAKRYSVKNFPTYIWVDGSGKQIHRTVGSTQVPSFMKIALKAVSTDNNLAFLEQQYNSGNKKPETMLSYAYALREAYNMTYQTVADEYFRTQPADSLSNEANWKNILEFTPNIDTYIYNKIKNNPVKFNEHYGEDSVRNVMDQLALQSLRYAAQQKDSVMLQKAVVQLRLSKNKDIHKQAARGELDFYKRAGRMDRYISLAPSYVTRDFWNDAKILNEICWTYFTKVDDKIKLGNSVRWIAHSVKLDESYYNTDTYANILHKLGRNKEALEMAKHSIELAKKSGEDYASTQELLDAILKVNGNSENK